MSSGPWPIVHPTFAGGWTPLFWLVVLIIPVLLLSLLFTALVPRSGSDAGWHPGAEAPKHGNRRTTLLVVLFTFAGVAAIVFMVLLIMRYTD